MARFRLTITTTEEVEVETDSTEHFPNYATYDSENRHGEIIGLDDELPEPWASMERVFVEKIDGVLSRRTSRHVNVRRVKYLKSNPKIEDPLPNMALVEIPLDE